MLPVVLREDKSFAQLYNYAVFCPTKNKAEMYRNVSF